MNLAVNARDAMPGGGRLAIETRNAVVDDEFARAYPTISPGPYVVLAVTDTGCGMTPEVTARIFEPFFTTKDVGKGTGLGLATVYGIAQQSGGCVVVRSEPDRGTTFELYLPCVGETPKTEEPVLAAAAAPSCNGTILLVEDESQVRAVMRSMLETSGYEVLEAANGQEAIRVITAHGKPVQLLVSDVVMPDMGGRHAAEALRAIQPGLRVLFVSGYTGEDILHDGVLKFDFGFLQKPFTPSALAEAVRRALNG
jgi:CheY-like chemotaxis protein